MSRSRSRACLEAVRRRGRATEDSERLALSPLPGHTERAIGYNIPTVVLALVTGDEGAAAKGTGAPFGTALLRTFLDEAKVIVSSCPASVAVCLLRRSSLSARPAPLFKAVK
jgi:hypothetical protein